MASLPAEGRWRADRIGSAVAVAIVHLLLGYVFMAGLTVASRRSVDEPLSLIVLDLMPVPEPARAPTPEPREPAEEEVVAALEAQPPPHAHEPVPDISVPPRPIVTPLVASGDGTGGGAAGAGMGAGRGGAGSGEGKGIGDGRGFTSARQIRGRFRNSDFPDTVRGAGRLKIGVRYAIGPSGRVDTCQVIESSGYPQVDAMTCRVIVDRYRFKPARDEQGFPVTEVLEEDYWWTMH